VLFICLNVKLDIKKMIPKGFLSVALCFIYSFNLIKAELNSDNVVIAINCGGEEVRDSKGVLYQKVEIILI
jgi:hypothetical protein